jgi:prevent-host-death family protein
MGEESANLVIALRLDWTMYMVYVGGMAVRMNIAEAKAKLSELVARAEAGEEIVLARDGKPVVSLTPIAKAGPARVGLLGQVEADEWDSSYALDEDDPADWGET